MAKVQKEKWRFVPGYHPYEVSDQGRVRRSGRVLAGLIATGGYRRIHTSIRNVKKWVSVHTMVLLAFKGSRPPNYQGGHGPAGKLVNTVENLNWLTASQQYDDRVRDGTDGRGEKNGRAILTRKQVDYIRAHHVPYCPRNGTKPYASRFGVKRNTIEKILQKRTWRD